LKWIFKVIVEQPKIIRTATVALSLDYLLPGQLAFLNKTYTVVAVSGHDVHLDNVAQREAVRVVSVPMQRAIKPLHDLVSLWQLYKLFKKEQPLIVHSITPKAGLLSMLAAKMAGVPIRIHTFTGLVFPSKQGFLQKLLITMDKVLCWSATAIIPEGNGVKNDLLAFNITSKPLRVIANGNINGINTAHFTPDVISTVQKEVLRAAHNILPDDFVFVFVGRLVGDKGINELVAAFSALGAAQSKLLLVGPYEHALDPLKPATREAIAQHSDIITTGFQTDVRPYMAISDALVFPSYREGFPNAVMQAGAMGLPSIVTNINGCNEIITHDFNGIIIPVKDPESLHIAMKLLLDDSALYFKLKNNARQHIVAHYEQQVVWDAILAEYKSLENHV
jgi:glycosyltransferase involved in cell wall biosynthesis